MTAHNHRLHLAAGRERPPDFGVEIAPGFFTWEAFHPEWRAAVRCAAYLPGRTIILIDPLAPPGRGGKRFWGVLDHLVLTERLPLHVVLTVLWHERSTSAIVARYKGKARVWCPAGGRDLSIRARRFRREVRLPGGVQALRTARSYEVLLWIPRIHTLLSGDVILGGKRRPLQLCPRTWLPTGVSRRDLAASLEPALGLPVNVIHVGHGAPVTSRAREALASALEAAR